MWLAPGDMVGIVSEEFNPTKSMAHSASGSCSASVNHPVEPCAPGCTTLFGHLARPRRPGQCRISDAMIRALLLRSEGPLRDQHACRQADEDLLRSQKDKMKVGGKARGDLIASSNS